MKTWFSLLIFILFLPDAFTQRNIIREGENIVNSQTGSWDGVNIPRESKTSLIFRNNSITSVNTYGYLLQAGDEAPLSTNNNLDGQIITGNSFLWKGTPTSSVITHGLFIGYNINSHIKYNYLENVPYSIIFKSGTNQGQNMTFTSGGCAYNIVKNGKFAIRIKGINGVKIFNNTFYNGDRSGWYFILITENMDRPNPSPSTGTKIFNNIFYTTSHIPMIKIESDCFENFECDYNIYWSTTGSPIFNVDNRNITFEQWKELGFDTHSVIMNPKFIDMTSFVPSARLNYGKNLGSEWENGLSTKAKFVVGETPETISQDEEWQVGARIHEGSVTSKPDDSTRTENIIAIQEADRLKVLVSSDLIGAVANLYNIKGQLISSKFVTSELFFFDSILSEPGVYVIIVEKGEISVVKKIVTP